MPRSAPSRSVVASAGSSTGPSPAPPAATAPPTSGHQGGLETQGRILLYGGLLLAFGLAIVGWVVIEPATGRIPPGAARAIGFGLIVAGIGSSLMLLASGLGLLGPEGRPDLVGYATQSRPGVLLLGRIVIGVAGGIVVLVLARRGMIEAATELGALAATAGIAVTVASGHAAVFEPPVTIAVWFVHAAAAGVWLAGLAFVAVVASRRPPDPPLIRSIVVRYSALAAVAIALVVLTGAYQAWVEIDGLPSPTDPYGWLLIVKIAFVVAAFVFGLMNYLDGGRLVGWLGGLGRRATIEAFLAAIVIVVTASLVAIPPPGPGRPIELAAAAGNGSALAVDLAISPGRPGPNRFTAIAPVGVTPTVLRLVSPGDPTPGEVKFRPIPEGGLTNGFVADVRDVGVAAWVATVVAAGEADGSTREFRFVMTADGIAEGRLVPTADVGLILGLAMLLAGIFGLAYARSGGMLPRTDRAAARIALTGGGLAAAVVGLLVVVFGPQL